MERTIGAGYGRGDFEIGWARNRPAIHRVPLPTPGDAVFFRSNDWFAPIPATMVCVVNEPMNPNLTFADPWPKIRVRVTPPLSGSKLDVSGNPYANSAAGVPFLMDCREARLAGAVGWLPLDWAKRVYPEVGM